MSIRIVVVLSGIAAVVLSTVACTSSFSARRIGPEGDVGARGGIPYTMTKPEFRIAETIQSGVSTYELQIASVPDPSNRYTLRASPAIFADTDFGIELNGRGGLDSTKVVTTDRIAPTITSLGTFAIGALTLVAALDADQGLAKTMLDELEKPGFRCPDDPAGTVRKDLIAFVRELSAPPADDNGFKRSMHARSAAQQKCIAALPVSAAVKEDINAILNLSLDEWRARHLAYLQRRVTAEIYRATLGGTDPEHDRIVRQLRLELARTVGEEAAQRRLFAIEDHLDIFPPKPSGDSSAYAEYARMREEARLLRERIAAAVGTTLAAVKRAPGEPFVGVVPRVLPQCVKDPKFAELNPVKCPQADYVVVLERVEE